MKKLNESTAYKVIGILFVLLSVVLFVAKQINKERYNKAVIYANNECYEEALETLDKLGSDYDGVEELTEQITNEQKYSDAMEYYNKKEYEDAVRLFEELAEGDYSDSKEMLLQVKYDQAISYYNEKKYEDALPIFIDLGYYNDSRDYYEKTIYFVARPIIATYYLQACSDYENGNFEDALNTFYIIRDFKNSEEFINACEKRLGILSGN